MIIGNIHGIYELSHKLPNNLRLRILGNKEISGRSQNFIELQSGAQVTVPITPKMKMSKLPKNCSKIEIEFFL